MCISTFARLAVTHNSVQIFAIKRVRTPEKEFVPFVSQLKKVDNFPTRNEKEPVFNPGGKNLFGDSVS